MTREQQIKKLDDEIIDLMFIRRDTKEQDDWDKIHSQILELESKVKILRAGGAIQEPIIVPKPEPAKVKVKPKLITEFSL